jgi:hypothetical protein
MKRLMLGEGRERNGKSGVSAMVSRSFVVADQPAAMGQHGPSLEDMLIMRERSARFKWGEN